MCEKDGTRVKWASHHYIYFINQCYAGGLSSFISLLIFFVSHFQICNSFIFNLSPLRIFFSFPFTLRRPCETEIFSVSPLAC